MTSDYYEKCMRSPEWEKKRQERLKIDNYRCRTCGETSGLEIHHVTYERLGGEDVENDLITLCKICHEAITCSNRRRRYANAEQIDIEFVRVPERNPVLGAIYGLEKIECEVVRKEIVDAQWSVGGSWEQILEGNETNYVKKTEHDRS